MCKIFVKHVLRTKSHIHVKKNCKRSSRVIELKKTITLAIEAVMMKTELSKETARAIHARRANPDIGFILANGEMNPSARKLYNVLIYTAQKQIADGRRGELPFSAAPDVLAQLPIGTRLEQFFWIAQRDLMESANVTRDSEAVRAWVADLEEVKVQRTVPGIWQESMRILQRTAFLNCTGGVGNKARWAIGFEFPSVLEFELLDPKKYTPISLYFQSFLKKEASLALYEVCRRYADWDGGNPPRLPWQEWQARLVGSKKSRQDYRYFNRDFLKPAIHEINEHTDILVEVDVSLAGKSVDKIRFVTTMKPQQSLELPHPADLPVFDASLINDLAAAGVSELAYTKLLSKYGEECCRRNVDLYKSQGGDKGAGWLVEAIKSDYADGEKQKQKAKREKVAAGVQRKAAQLAASSAAVVAVIEGSATEGAPPARERFLALDGDDREPLITEYIATAAGGALGPLVKNLKSDLAAAKYKTFAAKQFFAWLSGRV